MIELASTKTPITIKKKLPMRPILSEILTFRQHLNTLEQTPDRYRPPCCPYCAHSVIWHHGVYFRKPDRLNCKADSMNDIPIPRFRCANCLHTFSTLPECIAPARWYPWVIQQWCLWLSLNGWSVKQLNHLFPMARSTITRWINWLSNSFTAHHQVLCVQVSQMGYFAGCKAFWCHWLDLAHLSAAMVLINKSGQPVP